MVSKTMEQEMLQYTYFTWREPVSFFVAWNILYQAPKLDFEDSWSDRVFRQIRWKTSKEWGDRRGEPTRQSDRLADRPREDDRERGRFTDRPDRQLPLSCPVLAYRTDACAHASGRFTRRFTIQIYLQCIHPLLKSGEGTVITIILLLSVINRQAGASVEEGFKCSFT